MGLVGLLVWVGRRVCLSAKKGERTRDGMGRGMEEGVCPRWYCFVDYQRFLRRCPADGSDGGEVGEGEDYGEMRPLLGYF